LSSPLLSELKLSKDITTITHTFKLVLSQPPLPQPPLLLPLPPLNQLVMQVLQPPQKPPLLKLRKKQQKLCQPLKPSRLQPVPSSNQRLPTNQLKHKDHGLNQELMMLLKLPPLLNTMLSVNLFSPICIKEEHKVKLMPLPLLRKPQPIWLQYLPEEWKSTPPPRKQDKLLHSRPIRLMSSMLKNIMLTSKPLLLRKLLMDTPPGKQDMELKRDFH
jgi:hypothetical protein